ncbi:hypothetical protein DAERI_010077 [Deinococcus aerius]|uniref:PatA-like N-terminal domain-containing protein n=1 Tax=Deinococcus aerius TaxID=200253 RepID=A0A2I9DUB3_9DEIO|nr:DUF4388 domain-containing protein [Deinococcus aerius]GBF03905.1 hypothetical protein DAERI_010077 [Deinococcus aerius]
MTQSTTSLDPFDPLELLRLLAERGSTGIFVVTHPAGLFQVWLEEGRVQHLHFGAERGAAALARLLGDPAGQFHFEAGLRCPDPTLDALLDELVLEALDALPGGTLKFEGPAQFTSPERIARLNWTPAEREVLRQIRGGRPLADLAEDPEARRLILKLCRMRLLAPRAARVARLTVGVSRQGAGAALVDLQIHGRWQSGAARPLTQVAVRREDGSVVTLPVRGEPGLGPRLLLPPELLVHTGLRGGESVLVRPG